MTQFAADTFTGSDATELATYDANWVKHSASGANTADIRSNQAASTAKAEIVYYHNATPGSADYYVQADFYTNTHPGTSSVAVAGRIATGANTWYLVQLSRSLSVSNWQMYKRVAGTWTQLGSNVSITTAISTTYPCKIEMIGTAIKAYLNGSGSAGISVTDSAISGAGKAGLRWDSDANGFRADNFDATDTTGGGGSANAWYYRFQQEAAA